MSGSATVSDFWRAQGEVAAPGFAEPQRRWRTLIESSQQPERCTRLCSCGSQHDAALAEEEARSVGGMFSTLHAVGVCVVAAALEGCALVGSTAPWMATYTTSAALRAECAAAGVAPGFPCYFQPLSRCTLADARAAAAAGTSTADGLPNMLRRNQQDHLRLNPLLTEAARRTNLTSDLLLVSSAVAWAMRPRAPLADAVALHGGRLGLSTAGAGARSVGMHVRRVPLRSPRFLDYGRPAHTQPYTLLMLTCSHPNAGADGDKPANSARALGAAAWRVSSESFELWGRRVAAMLGAERVLYSAPL